MFLQVSSHRRSGTHLLIDELRAHFQVDGTFKHLEEADTADFDATGLVLIKTHEPFPGQKQRHFRATGHPKIAIMDQAMSDAKYVYIYRHPFAVLESLYYFDLAGVEPIFKIPADVTFLDFLQQQGKQDATPSENRVEHWCRHVSTWLDHPTALSIKYETFTADKQTALAAISQHIGVPMLATPLQVTPTSVGAGTSRKLKRTDLWGEAERDVFNRYADASLLARLGYPIA